MRNFGMTQVTGTLFGVRNMFDLYASSPIPNGFEEVENDLGIRHFVNKDSLSLGYMVDEAILEYTMNQTSVPFLSINAFVKSMGIEKDIYEPIELNFDMTEGVKEGGGVPRTGYKYSFENKSAATIVFTPDTEAVNDGDHLYLYLVSADAAKVTISDQQTVPFETKETKINAKTYQIVDLGYYEESFSKVITLDFNDDDLNGNLWVQCVRQEESAYQEMLEKLSDEQLFVNSYDSTHVEGTITAKEDGALFLTIPYDESWVATVDGVEAEILPVDDAFMAIRVSAGQHSIKLEYFPAKFGMCVKISVASLIVLIVFTIIRRIMESLAIKKRLEESEDSEFDVDEEEENSESVEDNANEPNSEVEKDPQEQSTEEGSESETDEAGKPEEAEES